MIVKLEQNKTNDNNSGDGFLTSAPRPSTMTNGPVASFHEDDRGEHAIEFLMILTFGVLPLIVAVYLLEDVLQEYVAFAQIFVSSPFF